MNVENTKNMKPGDARCPGPSTKDIIVSDGWDVPKELIAESYEFLGDEDIDYSIYTSQDVFDLEMKKLWPKVWQWACREEHIAEPGDYYVYDVGPHSIIVVRTQTNEIKAYYNACLHRGTQLKPCASTGSSQNLRCPFHGFTWSLDGELKEIPCRWDFPHIDDEDFRLPEVKVAMWGGFVFINMDENAKPLMEHLGPLADHFKNWPLEDRYVELHIQKTLPCNWKAAQEAFLEAYHVLETHPQGLPTAGDANAQYDVFSENVTRFVHTIGFPSPHIEKPMTQQDILDNLRGGASDEKVPEGSTARSVQAAFLRDSLGKQYDADLSKYSDSEMLDSIEYHLFPNMFLFPGISLPMIYRFRPNEMDVNSSIFDLLFLRPVPRSGDRPLPPDPVKIGIAESYASVPGMDPGLGGVYDQDTSNLESQQRGFRSSKKTGQTLGNYQEIRMRRVHKTLAQYLNA